MVLRYLGTKKIHNKIIAQEKIINIIKKDYIKYNEILL